ncbi:MAG: hypothetical protein IPM48_07215 [Saprospiraceae bacterium]|nr:hypothetical protein [Saprospiraceae bacterium]
MLANYYFSKCGERNVLLSIRPKFDCFEYRLTVDQQICDTKLRAGVGTFELQGLDLKILVEVGFLKTTATLVCNDEKWPLLPSKPSQIPPPLLKNSLTEKRNPSFSIFLFALSLIGSGIVLMLGFRNSDEFFLDLLPLVLFLPAGKMIASQLFTLIGFDRKKNRALLAWIVSLFLSTGLWFFLDTTLPFKQKQPGKLSALSSEIKTSISKVESRFEKRRKWSNAKETFLHHYEFEINAQKFSGIFKSQLKQFEVGDSITVHYNTDQPEINQLDPIQSKQQ